MHHFRTRALYILHKRQAKDTKNEKNSPKTWTSFRGNLEKEWFDDISVLQFCHYLWFHVKNWPFDDNNLFLDVIIYKILHFDVIIGWLTSKIVLLTIFVNNIGCLTSKSLKVKNWPFDVNNLHLDVIIEKMMKKYFFVIKKYFVIKIAESITFRIEFDSNRLFIIRSKNYKYLLLITIWYWKTNFEKIQKSLVLSALELNWILNDVYNKIFNPLGIF